MYEHITYEQILKQMLSRIPAALDKREGSVLYNALAPAAVELKNMYIQLDWMLDQSFADTQNREYLIRRAAERGLVPEAATNAVLEGVFDQAVPFGSRFSLGLLNYQVIDVIDPNKFIYRLQCEASGEEGNQYFGNLIPIDYLQNLKYAQLTRLLVPGEEAEDTEHFRKRYYESLNAQSFGGNIADYKEKTNSLNGVGGTKVYPTPNGIGGTVKLVLLDSAYGVPSQDLLQQIQTILDPEENQGSGLGLAPIGHRVTVAGVSECWINIQMNLTFQAGWSFRDVEGSIADIIDEYFLELRKNWSEAERLVVRISQIESRLLNITGILDISGTTLNKSEKNMELGMDEIPVRGLING